MKVKDGIIGSIIGDALGVPVEFTSRYELIETPVTRMEGYGTYNQPAGTWSDDSAMVLATMHSIVQKQCIDYTDIMDKFVDWLYNAKYMQGNHTFDCGITTSTAINNYKSGKYSPLECGCRGEKDNGNGSLMRILPLAFIKDMSPEMGAILEMYGMNLSKPYTSSTRKSLHQWVLGGAFCVSF